MTTRLQNKQDSIIFSKLSTDCPYDASWLVDKTDIKHNVILSMDVDLLTTLTDTPMLITWVCQSDFIIFMIGTFMLFIKYDNFASVIIDFTFTITFPVLFLKHKIFFALTMLWLQCREDLFMTPFPCIPPLYLFRIGQLSWVESLSTGDLWDI